MTTTGNTGTDILIIWAPLALVLIMGLLGLLRGARREAVVSLAIVIGALIITVWISPGSGAGSWAIDLQAAFSGLGLQGTETWLGVILLLLVALVIGYGMGSAVVARGPMSGMMRLGGFLLGLANGAALSGWLLRNYYLALQLDLSGSNQTTFNTIYSNVISHSLIVWANWFPLIVALIAAIVALVGPFRRAQTVVATPAAQTNWAPSTAPAATTAAAMPTSYTPQYPQQYAQSQPQQYTQPYAQQYQPQFGAQPQQPMAAPSAAVYSPSSYSAGPPSSPQPARVQDAPPTMPMPSSDLPRPSGSQDTHYFGGASSSPASTVSSPSAGAPDSGGTKSGPSTGPLGDLHDTAQAQSSPPAWAQTPDSSWLAAPKADGPSPQSPSSSSGSAVDSSEAPTMAYQVTSGSTSTSSTPGALTNCSRCGALVPGDATFCTECGNRLKS
jgi:hypothetical protein